MPRTVSEWIGRTDDTPPSASCKRRVLERQVTSAELRLETELERAVDEELTRYAETLRDPTIGMAM